MLAFCNSTSNEVWVAYMFHSTDVCGGEGQDWQTIGWFTVSPGSCTTVYGDSLGDVNNRYWYFFAQNASGSQKWTGPVNVYVTNAPFNHCLGIGTSQSTIVGFEQIDVGDNDDYTVTLLP